MPAMKRPARAPSARNTRRKADAYPVPDKLPVSTLCGFLGAGKTTLLKHILETKSPERDAFRCAVIVNDVAELNIDKSLLDQSALVQSDDVIALQNGCVCCTLQNDLVTQILQLAKRKYFHYMVIEASGVSEPSQIAKLFAACEENHDHDEEHQGEDVLNDFATLDTCVTVVDSGDFFNKFDAIKQGPKQESFPHLLVEQVEYANVIIVNKTDLVSSAQLAKVQQQLSILNPKATIVSSRNSNVDVSRVIGTGAYKEADFASLHFGDDKAEGVEETKDCCKASIAAGELPCCRSKRTRDSDKSKVVLSHNRPSKADAAGNSVKSRHAARFGITSFIFQARRPFHPERFDQNFVAKYFVYHEKGNDEAEPEAKPQSKASSKLNKRPAQRDRKAEAAIRKQQKEAQAKNHLRTQDMGDLCRSKGFIWLANRHELIGTMSQAGSVLTIDFPQRWCVLDAKAYEGTETQKEAARKDWVAPWGDRRQDLVFIGQNLKHEAIQDLLDSCLLTDEEMSLGVDGWKATMGDVLLDHAMEGSDADDDE